MSRESATSLGPECLPFFGKVAAGQCHEVVNVLNIINEQAGLIGDICAAGPPARVQELADKIQAQVQRGQGLVRSISRFAHSTDAIRAVVDAVELLSGAVDLLERPVRLAQSSLSVQLPTRPVAIETGPFLLLRLAYAAVELWLGDAPAAIQLEARAEDGGLAIQVSCPGGTLSPDATGRAGLESIAAQVEDLGGEMRVRPSAQHARMEFWIPASAAETAAPTPSQLR